MINIGLKYSQIAFFRELVREIGIKVVFLHCRMAQKRLRHEDDEKDYPGFSLYRLPAT